jgi:ferredoxin
VTEADPVAVAIHGDLLLAGHRTVEVGLPVDQALRGRGRGYALRPSSLPAVKVRVDAEKCQGHNRCYALAPELFDVDDFGMAVVIGDGEVTADLEEKARLAVANCPEYAISIEENGG